MQQPDLILFRQITETSLYVWNFLYLPVTSLIRTFILPADRLCLNCVAGNRILPFLTHGPPTHASNTTLDTSCKINSKRIKIKNILQEKLVME